MGIGIFGDITLIQVGKYEGVIREYIRNQLQGDIANDQLSLKELADPFTSEKAKKA